jgi:hypothetical protein
MLAAERMAYGSLASKRRAARARLGLALALGIAASLAPSRAAYAHGGDPVSGGSAKEAANPFRGSTFTVDQSITTQTADVGTTPQTYVPLYEVWLSFRPRYWFSEHWVLRGRFDYSKELTQNQYASDVQTTKNYQDVFGDIWTDFLYSTHFDSAWPGTTLVVGPRALWPTSQVSQANGTYMAIGALADVAHVFPVQGDDAPALNSVRVRVALAYQHAFTRATTPTEYGNFAYTREDVEERSFVSDQLTGQTLVNHRLTAVVEAALQATPRLAITADAFLLNDWHYATTQNQCIATTTGCAQIDPAYDQQFIQHTWLLLSVDYSVLDELDLGIGYYNLANALGPDGKRRGLWGADNIWWSPDARFFFDITANLDAIWDDALRHKYSTRQAAEDARRRSMGF